jgi:hypothetical protein
MAKVPALQEIVEALGFVRLAGTDGERRAAALIEGWLRPYGLKVKRQPFAIRSFDEGTAEIAVGGRVFKGVPFGVCGRAEVEAPLVFTENPAAVALNPERHRGKILLCYGRPRGLYHELRDAGIAGLLTISPPFRGAQSLSHRQHDTAPIPAATVAHDDAMAIAGFAGRPCRLSIRQKPFSAKACNLEVAIPGTSPDGSVTCLVGHYDSVARSPGACDNAGGCAVLVHLAAHFAKHPPTRDLRIIFFSGEELGLLGSLAYVKAHGKDVKKSVRLVLNVDVSGDDIGTDELYVTGTRELLGYASGVAREGGVFCNSRVALYSSDSIPFAWLGVPSVNIARYGGEASFHGHTAGDNPGRTTERGLRNTLAVAQALAGRVLGAAIYPVDGGIDESLREKLEHYLFHLTGKEPKLDWPPKYLKPPAG